MSYVTYLNEAFLTEATRISRLTGADKAGKQASREMAFMRKRFNRHISDRNDVRDDIVDGSLKDHGFGNDPYSRLSPRGALWMKQKPYFADGEDKLAAKQKAKYGD